MLRGPELTDRERLLFEAGIKLGGVFHQFIGVPVAPRTAPTLERAIERAVGLQPYVTAVHVRIRPERAGPTGRGRFAYRYLTAEMLEVDVHLADGSTMVEASLAFEPSLRYPLMRVHRLRSAARPTSSGRRSARR